MNESHVRLSGAASDFIDLAIARAVARGDVIQEEAFAGARGMKRAALEIKASMDALGESDFVSAIGTEYTREVLAPQTLPTRIGADRVLFGARMVGGSDTEVLSAWTSGGAPLPISEDSFFEDAALKRLKLGTIIVLTAELTRSLSPIARAIFEARIRRAVTAMVDRAFSDPTLAPIPNVSPGGIGYGAPSFDATGGSVSSIDSDAAAMLGVLLDGGSDVSRACWVMSSKVAVAWSLKRGTGGGAAYPALNVRGGTFLGLPAFTSPAVGVQGSPSEDVVLLVDPAGIALADDNELDVDASGQASVQMGSTPSAGATSLVSLWQKNLNGVRALRTINWVRKRDAAIVVLRHVVR